MKIELIKRITALIAKIRNSIVQQLPKNEPYVSFLDSLSNLGRRTEIEDTRKMYEEDTRVRGPLGTMARDVVGAGFKVVVANDKKAQQSANLLVKRLGLDTVLDDWVRLTARDGDGFYEVIVSDALEIIKVSRKPTKEMTRNSNEFDTFDDPRKAYYQSRSGARDKIWFASWQIIHLRFDHDEGKRNGTPAFHSARKAWKMLVDGEHNIAINRTFWAQKEKVHKISGGEQEIEAYRRINEKSRIYPE